MNKNLSTSISLHLERFAPEEQEAFLTEARRCAAITERYAALPAKREKINGSYRFVPAVLKMCKETACTNEIILSYYRTRQHPSRGRELRVARPVSPKTLDEWSRRYRKRGLLAFLPPVPLKVSAKDKRRARTSKGAIEWINTNERTFNTPAALYNALLLKAKEERWRIPSHSWIRRRWKEQGRPTVKGEPVYPGVSRHEVLIYIAFREDRDEWLASNPGRDASDYVRDLEAARLLLGL